MPPPNPAPPPRSLWQKIAGYQSASDVGPHAKIDEDMAEIETFCGYYSNTDGKELTWKEDAIFVYEKGGNEKCTQTEVDDTNNPWCTEVGGAIGNSLKGAVGDAADKTVIRNIKGFATKKYHELTGDYVEKLPPIYTAYWTKNGMTATEAQSWADTFITKDYTSITKDAGWNQLIKKGANVNIADDRFIDLLSTAVLHWS